MSVLRDHSFYIDQSTKGTIMKSGEFTNKQKLQAIFDIDKNELRKQFPELYYCILAVLDEDKISCSEEYFKSDNS